MAFREVFSRGWRYQLKNLFESGVFAITVGVATTFLFDTVSPGIFGLKKPQPTLEERIKVLTQNLNTAVKTISEMETEISQRAEKLAKIKQELEEGEQLKTLSQKQIEAVAQKMETVVARHEPSFLATHLTNIFYTLMGVVLTFVFQWGKRRWWDAPPRPKRR